jgi:hypothetical protein
MAPKHWLRRAAVCSLLTRFFNTGMAEGDQAAAAGAIDAEEIAANAAQFNSIEVGETVDGSTTYAKKNIYNLTNAERAELVRAAVRSGECVYEEAVPVGRLSLRGSKGGREAAAHVRTCLTDYDWHGCGDAVIAISETGAWVLTFVNRYVYASLVWVLVKHLREVCGTEDLHIAAERRDVTFAGFELEYSVAPDACSHDNSAWQEREERVARMDREERAVHALRTPIEAELFADGVRFEDAILLLHDEVDTAYARAAVKQALHDGDGDDEDDGTFCVRVSFDLNAQVHWSRLARRRRFTSEIVACWTNGDGKMVTGVFVVNNRNRMCVGRMPYASPLLVMRDESRVIRPPFPFKSLTAREAEQVFYSLAGYMQVGGRAAYRKQRSGVMKSVRLIANANPEHPITPDVVDKGPSLLEIDDVHCAFGTVVVRDERSPRPEWGDLAEKITATLSRFFTDVEVNVAPERQFGYYPQMWLRVPRAFLRDVVRLIEEIPFVKENLEQEEGGDDGFIEVTHSLYARVHYAVDVLKSISRARCLLPKTPYVASLALPLSREAAAVLRRITVVDVARCLAKKGHRGYDEEFLLRQRMGTLQNKEVRFGRYLLVGEWSVEVQVSRARAFLVETRCILKGPRYMVKLRDIAPPEFDAPPQSTADGSFWPVRSIAGDYVGEYDRDFIAEGLFGSAFVQFEREVDADGKVWTRVHPRLEARRFSLNGGREEIDERLQREVEAELTENNALMRVTRTEPVICERYNFAPHLPGPASDLLTETVAHFDAIENRPKREFTFISGGCGSGKSHTAMAGVAEARRRGWTTIWVTPRDSLVQQTMARVRDDGPTVDLRSAGAGFDWSQRSLVVVTTIHSLRKIANAPMLWASGAPPMLLVFDEARTVFLSDCASALVRTGPTENILSLLMNSARAVFVLDAHLPPLLARCIVARVRDFWRPAASAELLFRGAVFNPAVRPLLADVTVRTIRLTYNMVEMQERSAAMIYGPASDSAVLGDALYTLMRTSDNVAIFFAKLATLRSFEQVLNASIGSDKVLVYTSDEHVPVHELIERLEGKRAFLYTTAAGCGVDVRFIMEGDEVMHFANVYVIEGNAPYISPNDLVQVVSRVRCTKKLIVDIGRQFPESGMELIDSDAWRSVYGASKADILRDLHDEGEVYLNYARATMQEYLLNSANGGGAAAAAQLLRPSGAELGLAVSRMIARSGVYSLSTLKVSAIAQQGYRTYVEKSEHKIDLVKFTESTMLATVVKREETFGESVADFGKANEARRVLGIAKATVADPPKSWTFEAYLCELARTAGNGTLADGVAACALSWLHGQTARLLERNNDEATWATHWDFVVYEVLRRGMPSAAVRKAYDEAMQAPSMNERRVLRAEFVKLALAAPTLAALYTHCAEVAAFGKLAALPLQDTFSGEPALNDSVLLPRMSRFFEASNDEFELDLVTCSEWVADACMPAMLRACFLDRSALPKKGGSMRCAYQCATRSYFSLPVMHKRRGGRTVFPDTAFAQHAIYLSVLNNEKGVLEPVEWRQVADALRCEAPNARRAIFDKKAKRAEKLLAELSVRCDS